MKLLFGYKHVTGVPLCPCRDPGNYLMAEQDDDPLEIIFRCWCGSRMVNKWDSPEELAEFLQKNGVTSEA